MFSALNQNIGVQVHGVDLAMPISPPSYRQIHEALVEHSILLFRDQDITPEQHIAFSRCFGDLEEHVVTQFLLPGHPEILVISNVVENGRHIGAYGGAKHFHSDLSYKPEPSLGSLFYCRECPPQGGETEFSSMYAAYDSLPPERQRWLESQRGVHNYIYHYETFLSHRDPLTDEQKAKLPPTSHPAVRTHPETGRKAIFVSQALTSHFEGLEIEESRRIIKELTNFATQSQFVYRHKWRPGDLVFWDNRSTLHKANPFDESKYRRVMHRTTVKGDRPFLTHFLE